MDRRFDLNIPKDLIADKRISVTARLVLAQLLDHRNRKTGQCNPRRKTLARELGVSMRTLTRILAELRKLELIRYKQAQYTNSYEIQDSQNGHPEQGSGWPKWPPQDSQNGHPGLAYPLTEPNQLEGERTRAEARSRSSPPPQRRKPPERQLSLVERTKALIARRIANGERPI